MRSRFKLILFSLVPVIVLLGMAEMSVRLLSLDHPSIIAGGSGVGPDSIVQPDHKLGWSLKPNSTAKGITINSIGLRSPEILPKKDNEYRILSLGESTTFGIGVDDHQTYSAQLQVLLNDMLKSRSVTVINAGVSAYSSYQSLKYIEEKGLNLKPDMILFYHELNDYLPTAIRDTYFNEVGMTKSDKEMYESKLVQLSRILEEASGLYRFLSYRFSMKKINQLKKEGTLNNPLTDIGLSPYGFFQSRIADYEGDNEPQIPFNYPNGEEAVKLAFSTRRVTDEERLDNFNRLLSISRNNSIDLLIIHPAYLKTSPHECLLTRFCRNNSVMMFEAFLSLHPESIPLSEMYVDATHPSAKGHYMIARDLANFIHENILK